VDIDGKKFDHFSHAGFSASPSTCVSTPRPVLPEDLFVSPESWWESQVPNGKPMPKWITANLAKNGKGKEGPAIYESQPMCFLIYNRLENDGLIFFIFNTTSECKVGDRILWMYTSTGDLQFELICKPKGCGREEVQIWPKTIGQLILAFILIKTICLIYTVYLTVCSLSVPEHDAVDCRVTGQYICRFCGVPSFNWLMGALGQGTKVTYFIDKVPNGSAARMTTVANGK
jgi:hypothetical protein